MSLRALIIDDSLTVRMDLDEAFRAAGFETRLCETAAAARRAIEGGGFALVVLDVLLPDGDGITLLGEIRARAEAIPVLLLSTEAEVRDRIRGLKMGADEYVGKPYDSAHVVGRAKELVGRADRGPAAPTAPTVLLIDDSPTFRDALRQALERSGYEVSTASSGEEGLKAAAWLRPSAIVVDGQMPGIDGAGVIRRIRQDAALRRTPCLLLTGSGGRAGELLALDAGADAYLRKDVDPGVVLARLSALLRPQGLPAGPTPASLLAPKRVLAVDDSPTYLQALASQLREEGYDVATATSGEEALDLLAVQPPDCVLLDLMMPGLSGHDTCRRIRGNPAWRDIPVIILSALDERDAMLEGINAGADDYITKSGDSDVLSARLRAQLRRRQFEEENRHIREQLLRSEMEAAEARAARELAEMRARLLAELEKKNRELEDKNRELESFSYSVSHDLRAPLRAIDGFARILEEEHGPRLDEEARRCIGVVRGNAVRMGGLIDDLLRLSRMGRQGMSPGPLDLAAECRSVFEELRAGRPVELKVGGLPEAYGDRTMVRQLLHNLLSNAVKYSSKRQTARVEVGVHGDPADRTYYVRDNGVGFDMQYASKLFGLFQRLHADDEFEGTGVGLAIVQRIVQRHGGRVWAESKPGEGATFFFSLPAAPPPGDP